MKKSLKIREGFAKARRLALETQGEITIEKVRENQSTMKNCPTCGHETKINYQDRSLFEPCPEGYILKAGDRMRRGGSYNWFALIKSDIGEKASHFSSGIFYVEKLKTN